MTEMEIRSYDGTLVARRVQATPFRRAGAPCADRRAHRIVAMERECGLDPSLSSLRHVYACDRGTALRDLRAEVAACELLRSTIVDLEADGADTGELRAELGRRARMLQRLTDLLIEATR